MLIHAYPRKKPVTVELFGKNYKFVANDNGDFVAEVKEPEAVKRFLSISDHYQEYGAPPKADGEADTDPNARFLLTSGDETINLLELDKDQLLAFAKENDIEVHPNAKAETLRERIIAALKEAV